MGRRGLDEGVTKEVQIEERDLGEPWELSHRRVGDVLVEAVKL